MGKRLTTAPRGNLYHEISERAFTAHVLELAARLGWLCYHARPAQSKRGRWLTPVQGNGGAGFPDLVMVRGPGVIFAELKSKNGKLSEDQLEWIRRLTAAGDVYVWRPSDIENIERVLR